MIKTTEDIVGDLKNKAKEVIDIFNQVLVDFIILEDKYKNLKVKRMTLTPIMNN